MNQHSTLSEDQLREPPTVHLAIGMIAAEHDLSCADAFDRLHQQALDEELSLVGAAREVVRRDDAATGDTASSGRRPRARGRWAIRDARDLMERAGRR